MAMVKQYYFDALPIHPQPEQLESFTSYLTRLAEINGKRSVTGLAAIYSLESRPYGNSLRYLKDYPPSSFGTLELVTGCPEARLLQTTFYYLGKKFGRSMENSQFSSFLFKSLGSSLRYCSECLNERPSYYSLSWRFLGLQGCHKHACKLFERCPHCGSEIPFIALPFKIGICPACKGNLRLCTSEALTEEERREAFIFSQEVEFLLSSQTWEDTYTSIAKNVGKEYALLREVKGYTAKEVKSRIGVEESSSKIAAIDFGRSKGATLQDYATYAKYLEVSLQDIFCLMLTRTEGDVCFEKVRREFLPPEEYILEKAQLIVNRLKSEGEQVTRQAIREELRISESSLRKYPHVKIFLDQHAGIFHYQRKEHVQVHKNEVFGRVLEAIKYLNNLGKPITYNSVGEIVGLPAINLKAYPQVVALIKQQGNFHDFQKEQHLRREGDLLVQVQDVIQQMRNRGQVITKSAIAREIGMHLCALQWYGRVKDFLDQEVISNGVQLTQK